MTLLMMYNFGPNFMLMPFAKLELFKKQILLTSAFFGFCGMSLSKIYCTVRGCPEYQRLNFQRKISYFNPTCDILTVLNIVKRVALKNPDFWAALVRAAAVHTDCPLNSLNC